jgi:glycosyltransferase involved in cell wall biosynthesis/GNAT superfamily N-acetyltransferase
MAVRVLWVAKGLGPGGAERLLVAAAQRHDHARFEFECAYVLPWKDHLAGELEAAGVRAICVSRTRRDLRWPLRLAKLVRDGHYDVVHVHSPLPGSVARLAARTLPAASRPRIIATEHNRWETHRLPTRWLNRLTSRWNQATYAVTDEVLASVRGRAGDGLATLRHGIDVAAVGAQRAERPAVRRELGLADDEFVVGTVANFRPQKDYPNLLAAARHLADDGVPVRIVAVGQGPDEAAVRALHDSLGLGDRVLLTGFRADATRVMAACDAFVLASQWEGLPVALMEALALGLPVAATAVGGVAEELQTESDALLVPASEPRALADAIARLATDRPLRERLAARSAELAQRFDVGLAVDEYERLYGGVPEPAPAATEPERPKRRRAEADIRPAQPDDRAEILALLGRSLGSDPDDPRLARLFAWKHDTNRFGPSPMWVVVDGGRVIAFRALMRWEFERGGDVLRAVRAVDTATDPDHQGRGLFTALTLHALDAVRAEGVAFVFNTPNSQSRPGYLKMGWREVGSVPAAVRVTGPAAAVRMVRARVPADRWSLPLAIGTSVEEWLAVGGVAGRRPAPTDVRQLRTRIDDEYLSWRFGGDLLHYRAVDNGKAAVIVRGRHRGPATELAVVAEFGQPRATRRLAAQAAKEASADYAIHLGESAAAAGWLPLPGGGPILTWRAVTQAGMPPLANWSLELGDIELF